MCHAFNCLKRVFQDTFLTSLEEKIFSIEEELGIGLFLSNTLDKHTLRKFIPEFFTVQNANNVNAASVSCFILPVIPTLYFGIIRNMKHLVFFRS